MSKDYWEHLLTSEVQPVKLGNKNKTGKCGMCGEKAKTLYPRKVGQVEFMICESCKCVMEL